MEAGGDPRWALSMIVRIVLEGHQFCRSFPSRAMDFSRVTCPSVATCDPLPNRRTKQVGDVIHHHEYFKASHPAFLFIDI